MTPSRERLRHPAPPAPGPRAPAGPSSESSPPPASSNSTPTRSATLSAPSTTGSKRSATPARAPGSSAAAPASSSPSPTPSTTRPYYSDERATIYHGDALDVLHALEGLTVDAVITDPPFASGSRTEASKSSSGAMLRGKRFSARPIELDQMTTTGFVWLMRTVAMAARPMLPDGGSFLSFIDWRQWPNLTAALETVNYRIQTMIVWDKQSMGTGNGFRNQHELICHAAKGVPNVYNRSVANVLRCKREPPVDHPSPKPPALLEDLIRVVTPPGGVILDPFAGTGPLLEAAARLGRHVIAIELEESYCERAVERIQQLTL